MTAQVRLDTFSLAGLMRAGEYGDSSSLPALASNLSAVLADLTPIKDCMASPASAACTGGAGSQSQSLSPDSLQTHMEHQQTCLLSSQVEILPVVWCLCRQIISGKCDGSVCSTLSQDLNPIKTCMEDPTDTACSGLSKRQNYNLNDVMLYNVVMLCSIFQQGVYGSSSNLPEVLKG